MTDGLVRTSERIYDALMLGRCYPETVGEGKTLNFNLRYVDWEHPENNLYHVTEEFQVFNSDGQHDARSDIVLFINGIPFAVIECKVLDHGVNEAVNHTVRNQRNDYIPQLYKFAQILLATNTVDVKHDTTDARRELWSFWKEQDEDYMAAQLRVHVSERTPTEQDLTIIFLLHIDRALFLVRNFIIYDANVKKIYRYQQFFAIQDIVRTVEQTNERENRQAA